MAESHLVVTISFTTSALISHNDTGQPTSTEEIVRIIDLVVKPLLVVFGTIGNGLSFYIMRKTSLKNLSTCFYMFILAVADTGMEFIYNILQFCFSSTRVKLSEFGTSTGKTTDYFKDLDCCNIGLETTF